LIGKHNDTPSLSLKDSNTSSKVETAKEEGIEICFLVCNISKVEGYVEALGWELKRVTNESIIHTNLHKPNKLISVWFKHF
jgi:hypothetical protein